MATNHQYERLSIDEHLHPDPTSRPSSRPSSPALSDLDIDDDGLSETATPAITRRLYASHFLSTWNSRGFEFGSVLFLATAYPGSLLPMSVYALVRALSAIIFAPAVGTYIDTNPRLTTVRLSIVAQRAAVVSSCLVFWFLLRFQSLMPFVFGVVMLTILSILACVEELCAIMNTIAVERDWVVVIGQGDETVLGMMNSQMRRTDLFCKLVSPLAVALLDGKSSEVAVLTTLITNTVSMTVEYGLIATVYRRVPALSQKIIPSKPKLAVKSKLHTFYLQTQSNLKTYVRHPTFLPSFSLCLLYFSVLSFAGQMTTYLLATGLTSTTVGVLRTFSTAFELSATFVGPWLMSRIGAVRAGAWSLSWLAVCLTGVVGVLWTFPDVSSPLPSPFPDISSLLPSSTSLSSSPSPSSPSSTSLLSSPPSAPLSLFSPPEPHPTTDSPRPNPSIQPHPPSPSPKTSNSSIPSIPPTTTPLYSTSYSFSIFILLTILSRLGLWSFDLCSQLLIQTDLSPNPGQFSSTEASVRNIFEVGRFAATIFFSRPNEFKYPALMSLVAVYVSVGFYVKFVRLRRGHVLHLSRIRNWWG